MAVENIKVDAKTGLVNFYGEAAQTEAEALKTEFTSISEAATGVSDAITALNDLLTNFQVSDAFREFVTLMTQLVTGSAGVTKTVEGAQNAANMEEVAGEGEGDGENERTITLNIDITAAELAFKTIEEYYTKLAQLVSTPISVDLNSVTATTS
jgi:predicted translin family RNA/ssDNA-binding protein